MFTSQSEMAREPSGDMSDTHEAHVTIQLKPKKVEKPVAPPAAPKAEAPKGVNPTGTPIEPDPALLQKAETTQLSPLEEALFQAWGKANRLPDIDHPDSHYDYRGFYKASNGAVHPPGSEAHFPDTFKQHGHPTFSIQSKYSKGPFDGGTWNNEAFLPQMTPAVSHSQQPVQEPIQQLLDMLKQR